MAFSYFTPIVTANELLARFVSVPTNEALPVVDIVPVALKLTPTVTTMVCPPDSEARVQFTVPPAVPGAGPEHAPMFEDTDWKTIPGASDVVKVTPLATMLWLSLICHVRVSEPVKAGPPF